MLSPLQDLKQTRTQCLKLISWVDKLPEELGESWISQIQDMTAAIDEAIKSYREGGP